MPGEDELTEQQRLLDFIFSQIQRRRLPPAPPPFADPNLTGPEGLVAVGGTLTPELILEAYSQGIFPMADPDGTLGWWSPHPRTVLELDRVHVSRRLRRTLRQARFEIRLDTAFDQVIAGCAARAETWISQDFVQAYGELHRRGHVHCVEAWCEGRLAGGLYGVSLGGAFMAESMFHTERDASKVAVVGLVEHLRQRGMELLDIQYETSATAIFHPAQITRRSYLARLRRAVESPHSF